MTPNDPKRTKKAVESVQRLCGSDLDSYQTHLQCSCQMSPKYQVMKPHRLRARSDRPLNPSHLNPLAPTILDEQMLKIDLESLTDDCGGYSTNKKKQKKLKPFSCRGGSKYSASGLVSPTGNDSIRPTRRDTTLFTCHTLLGSEPHRSDGDESGRSDGHSDGRWPSSPWPEPRRARGPFGCELGPMTGT